MIMSRDFNLGPQSRATPNHRVVTRSALRAATCCWHCLLALAHTVCGSDLPGVPALAVMRGGAGGIFDFVDPVTKERNLLISPYM